MHVDEFMEMYNRSSRCNYAWNTVHSDLKRLGIEFNRDARKIINGVSQKRCIIGIKLKEAKYKDEFVEDKKDDNGLDFGIQEDKTFEQKFIGEKKQHTELKAEYERIKQEFEAYKQLYPPQPKVKPTIGLIEDSDDDNDSEVDTTDNKIVNKIKPKK
jgi:hypothetical protein